MILIRIYQILIFNLLQIILINYKNRIDSIYILKKRLIEKLLLFKYQNVKIVQKLMVFLSIEIKYKLNILYIYLIIRLFKIVLYHHFSKNIFFLPFHVIITFIIQIFSNQIFIRLFINLFKKFFLIIKFCFFG